MLIREAEVKDAKDIATLHVKTWQHAYKGQIPDRILENLSVKDRTKHWKEKLMNPDENAKTFVAVVDSKIVGFSSSGPSRDKDANRTTGELYAVYIKSESWGKGLGSALLKRALEYLKKLGFKQATLWVLESNKPAREFYEKLGWKEDGKSKTEMEGEFEMKEIRYNILLK